MRSAVFFVPCLRVVFIWWVSSALALPFASPALMLLLHKMFRCSSDSLLCSYALKICFCLWFCVCFSLFLLHSWFGLLSHVACFNFWTNPGFIRSVVPLYLGSCFCLFYLILVLCSVLLLCLVHNVLTGLLRFSTCFVVLFDLSFSASSSSSVCCCCLVCFRQACASKSKQKSKKIIWTQGDRENKQKHFSPNWFTSACEAVTSAAIG